MRAAGAVVAAVLLAGCGGSSSGLAPAQVLVVTLDGKPAAGLSLKLTGDNGATGSGATGDDGRAAVRGNGDQPLPPGTYRVTVTDAGGAEENPMAPPKPTKSRVPAEYARPATTPITVVIEAGKMEYPIAMKAAR
jgi:hypothetical protein